MDNSARLKAMFKPNLMGNTAPDFFYGLTEGPID